MKRIIALTLMAALLLSGCSIIERANQRPPRDAAAAQSGTQATTAPEAAAAETTQAPTTEPTTEPTTVPTEPPFNPLNGEILDEPYTGRIVASTISNIRDAMPHVGVNDADILMEMFVNGSIIRCLALYTDVSKVEEFGSIRSTRLMFSDIAQHYDAVICHAAGSETCLDDLRVRGVDNINMDRWDATWSFRNEERTKKYGLEHSLMGIGSGVVEYMQANGIATTQSPDKDYCLRFTDDGTPADGEPAENITITLTYGRSKKPTTMIYDAELGKYVFNQYEQVMKDGNTDEVEAFQNVIVMLTSIDMADGIYHVADFVKGGTGYFACGGKLIPIQWECDSEDSPFRFLTGDGQVLQLGRGNTYIAICSPDSTVEYE